MAILLGVAGEREKLQIESVNLGDVLVASGDADDLAAALVEFLDDLFVGVLGNSHRDATEVPFGFGKVE